MLPPKDIEKRWERGNADTFLLAKDSSGGEYCHTILLNYHIGDNGREGESRTVSEEGGKYKHLKKSLSIILK